MAVNPPGMKSSAQIKNVAAAPIIFFDNAPVFGHANGVIQITVAAQTLGLRADNTVSSDIKTANQNSRARENQGYLKNPIFVDGFASRL